MAPSHLSTLSQKKVPAIEIAGLCLPLKPQKENVYVGVQQIIFYALPC
jgi:hypothetical protein